MTEIFNQSGETTKRRQLRQKMAPAERIIWPKLKNRQFCGYKFRRQYSVGRYVVDFYCPKLKLAIEIDGLTHFTDEAKEYDKERQQHIESLGIRFLRFENTDIYQNLEGCLEKILLYIRSEPKSSPSQGEAG